MKKSRIHVVSCAALIGYLVSCSTLTHPPVAYQGSAKAHHTLVKNIEKHDIQVIEMGQQVLIIVPIDHVFILQSQEIDPAQQGVFATIAKLIQTYPNARVSVRGYVDNVTLSLAAQHKQSAAYAAVVASYLWNAGVPKEQITIEGAGAADTIASDVTTNGRVENRRVEIKIDE